MASSHPTGRPLPGRGGPLIRWARFAAQHPGKVLIGWVVGLAVLVGIMSVWGGVFTDSFSIPDTESQDAVDLLEERFPSQAGDTAQVVFQSDTGVTDPAVQARIDAFLAEAATLPEVVGVSSPYTGGGVSADGTIAYSTVQYAVPASDIATESYDAPRSRWSTASWTRSIWPKAGCR